MRAEVVVVVVSVVDQARRPTTCEMMRGHVTLTALGSHTKIDRYHQVTNPRRYDPRESPSAAAIQCLPWTPIDYPPCPEGTKLKLRRCPDTALRLRVRPTAIAAIFGGDHTLTFILPLDPLDRAADRTRHPPQIRSISPTSEPRPSHEPQLSIAEPIVSHRRRRSRRHGCSGTAHRRGVQNPCLPRPPPPWCQCSASRFREHVRH